MLFAKNKKFYFFFKLIDKKKRIQYTAIDNKKKEMKNMAKARKVGTFIAGAILIGGILCTAGTNAGKIVVESKLSDAKYFYNEYENDLSVIKGTFLDEEFYAKKQQELAKLDAQKEEMDAMEHAAKKAYVESDAFAYDYIKANNEDFYNETVKPLTEGSIRNYEKIEKYSSKSETLSAVAAGGLVLASLGTLATISGSRDKEREC